MCFTAPFKPDAMSLADCKAQKGDLGIKECYYDGDYWAGAVKACGGVDKMPTQAQLTALANELYDKPISGSGTEYANWDKEKAESMGFDPSYGWFSVWSGEERSNYSAYGRHFYPTDTNYSNYIRYGSDIHAVCLGD